MDVVIGVLQDSAGGSYTRVIWLVMMIKALAFFLGLGYLYADHNFLGKTASLSEKARVDQEALVEDPTTSPLTARPVKRWVTWASTLLLGSMVITGWVLFIKYLL